MARGFRRNSKRPSSRRRLPGQASPRWRGGRCRGWRARWRARANRARCARARSEVPGTEPQAPASVRYRSSLQVMILVIGFSCLSRGPDDQGLSCGPGCDHRQERPAGGGSRSGLKSGETGTRTLPARDAGHRWWREQAIWYGGKISEGAPRRVCPARAIVRSGRGISSSGRAAAQPISRTGDGFRAGSRARGFRGFRVRDSAADFRRRLVLPQTFIDDLAQQVVLRPGSGI